MVKAQGIALVLSLLFLGRPAAAEATTEESLVRELQRVGVALERLLELQESQSLLSVVLRRLELLERRLEPLERQLHEADAEYRGLTDNLRSLDGMEEQHEALLQEEIRRGSDSPASDTRRTLADIRRTRESNLDQQRAAGARRQQLESELAAERREIEALDATFLEMLDAAGKLGKEERGPG